MMNPSKKMRLSSPGKPAPNCDDEVQDLLAGIDFDDDFFPEYEKENVTQNGQAKVKVSRNSPSWRRCLIQNINNEEKGARLLTLSDTGGNDVPWNCRLEPPWTIMKLEIGDLISIKPSWSDDLHVHRVDKDNGYLITLPDHLMSGTTLMGSLFCRRKGALQELFKGMDADNEIVCYKLCKVTQINSPFLLQMMVGTIIHEILESVLKQKLRTLAEIKKYCQEYISSPAVSYMLYSSDCPREKLSEEVTRFVPKIYSFIDRYVTRSNRSAPTATSKEEYGGTIEDIEDTEENIWLPKMGLKGKVDLTVRVKCGANRQSIPLELKTGKASFSAEHRGQVTLYQMMMEESGRDARSGLLLYLREGMLREVVSSRNEKRDLILLRNELSRYLSRKFTTNYGHNRFLVFPEPVTHRNFCEKCPYNTICCSLLSRDSENVLPDTHPLKKAQKIDHLSQADLDYFFRWCQISYLEDQHAFRNIAVSNIWTDSVEKRMKDRKTIFGLKLKTIQEVSAEQYLHEFVIDPAAKQQVCDWKSNEYVVVSCAPDKWAVATGFTVQVSDTAVSLNLNKKLSEFRSEMLRVDRYESQSMLSYHLTNLGILLEDSERSSRIRDVISRNILPAFADDRTALLKGPEAQNILKTLNEGQRVAIEKSLTCKNYLLIKGLPGTGKTQTISALVRLLVLHGQSVLITAHTHSAVDNLLLRIKPHGVPFLRLGSPSRVHSDIAQYCESVVIDHVSSPEEIAKKLNSFPVVACTCLGAGHVLLAKRQFDVCIVDEATQVIQSALLRPLFSCSKFILIGDPDQLPPVLQSAEAIACGGDRSLFLELDDAQLGSTAKLTVQYRMNKTITKLANQFMYKNELTCGNENVEKQSLDTLDMTMIPKDEVHKKLFMRVLSPHLDLSTILIDTGPVEELNCKGSGDRRKGKMNVNHCEISLILKLVHLLKNLGMRMEEVGIIAPFRIQVDAIKNILKKRFGADHLLEVNTVDQYQGRDKDVIIYSGTKTEMSQLTDTDAGERDSANILNDKRRLNVAITRAKKKLILIADRKCLEKHDPFAELFNYLKGPQLIRVDWALIENIVEEYFVNNC